MPSVALLRRDQRDAAVPGRLEPSASVGSPFATRVATPVTQRAAGVTVLDKRSDPKLIIQPASLRSEGGNIPVDWVAEILWTGWQHSHGLGGRNPWNTQVSPRGPYTRISHFPELRHYLLSLRTKNRV